MVFGLKPAFVHQVFFCLQGAESQLSQVADRKVADKDVINQGDATQIARAEAKLNDGQIPPNSISAKAQVHVLCRSNCTMYAHVGLTALCPLMWVWCLVCRIVGIHMFALCTDVGVFA